MDISLSNLSKQEHKLIENAANEFGKTFTHAHDIVFFTWTFITSIKPEAYTFSLFLSQIQKSLVLCLLSALRNHDVQYHMMLRHVLENTSLACFSLYETNTEEFCRSDENDILYADKSASKKAYKWLENNYHSFSAKIKNIKDNINESFAHASILPGPLNMHMNGNTIGNLFFDKPDKLMTQQRLWWTGNVTLGILTLFEKIIQKYPKVNLVDDFAQRMFEFSKDDTSILAHLMINPRLSRWIYK